MTDPLWPKALETSRRLGVSRQYVVRLLNNGRLNGQLRGNTWLISPESLRQYEATRGTFKPGRKKKPA
jgi:excisionase family DNA binding protein